MIKPEGEILFQLLLDKTFDAAACGDYRVVRETLGVEVVFPDGKPRRISANSRGEDGGTLLQMAVCNDHFSIIELLLDKGADPNASDDQRDTALHQAAMTDARRSARLLLAAGADPNAQNISGRTPLHFAVMQGNTDLSLQLLNAGSNLDLKNRHGLTPLMSDFMHGQGKIARALINAAHSKGAPFNIDACNDEGKTLLHLAAHKKLATAIADLLIAGANPLLADKKGKTALSVSYENGDWESVDLLRKAEKEHKRIIEKNAKMAHEKNLERLDSLPQHQRSREAWNKRKRFP